MALHGSLKIGGRTYGVYQCSYSFSQEIDDTGIPNSRPKGGEIEIVIPSTNDDDMFFYNWMFNKTEVKSGILRLCLYSTDNKRSYKTVSFANAYCIGLSDFFSDHDARLMYTTIKIQAQVIMIGSVNHSIFVNPWTLKPLTTVITNLKEHVKSTVAQALNPFKNH